MSKVIAIANQKGGVGKTTTAVNFRHRPGKRRKKVLLIDVDPQGSLTASLGYVEPDELYDSLATVLEAVIDEEKFEAEKGILHHDEGVDVLPGNIELSAIEAAMTSIMRREVMMREYLERVKEKYDYILIDCMPSLGMMTVNALVDADSVLISVQAAYLPVKGCLPAVKVNLTERKLRKYFPASYTSEDMESVIIALLEVWKTSQGGE